MSSVCDLFGSTQNSLTNLSNISSSLLQLKIQSKFGITSEELRNLMEAKGDEAVEKFKQMGSLFGLCSKLKIKPDEGLDDTVENIRLRKQIFGTNKLIAATSKSFLTLILEALQEKTLIMLEVCAFISLAMSFYHPTKNTDHFNNNKYSSEENHYGYIESIGILLSILITVLVMACSEYSKESKFRALQNRLEKEHKINVLRNRAIHEISTSDLVVGDICIIKYGDVIPADGILLESNELKIDESSMTGESDLVEKIPNKNIRLYSGTCVMDGNGRMIVVAVGENSQTGVIYSLMRSGQKAKSVLQCKLADLAVKIGYFGISVAVIAVVMLFIRSCIVNFGIRKETIQYKHVKEFFDHIITGITILVVAVPEGLPLAVTLSLAYSVKQMMKDNNLVRHIDACETLGNATTICSDKTGTLTANRMTAVQCYICGVHYRSLSKRQIHLKPDIADILSQNIALNSSYTSRLVKDENNVIRQFGNKTECALLGFCFKLQQDYVQIRQQFSDKNFHRIFPFNSTRKLMRTIINLPDNKGFRLLAKGASEIIIRKCSFIVGYNGELLLLNAQEKGKIVNRLLKVMAANGLRVICLAYLDYLYDRPEDPRAFNCRLIERGSEPCWEDESSYIGMTFLAAVGIEDPVRNDVHTAIQMCQKAGITIRMVTGDNIDTARSIAIKCGILDDTNKRERKAILASKEYNQIIRNEQGEIDQALFDKVWPELRVLARSTPTDKYILVKHIIASKIAEPREVVAVTGDGTNDAPALKMADVGFAMGIAGTEVAKEASDIILTDDNFSSIVKSVIWGRNVYDSINKFIQFQLTVNIVAVMICFITACIIQQSPLRPVQMLWVNLIMDTLGSLALSTEKPSNTLLLRKPYGRNKPLISATMLQTIIFTALYQLIVLVLFLFFGPFLFDFDSGMTMADGIRTEHFTMLFNIFVMMTLFNEINSRKINGDRNIFDGITTNWIFCMIFLITFILQIFIVQFGGIWFSTCPLNGVQWMWCIVFGLSILVWSQILTSLNFRGKNYYWLEHSDQIFY